jgi:hypothetical protein
MNSSIDVAGFTVIIVYESGALVEVVKELGVQFVVSNAGFDFVAGSSKLFIYSATVVTGAADVEFEASLNLWNLLALNFASPSR